MIFGRKSDTTEVVSVKKFVVLDTMEGDSLVVTTDASVTSIVVISKRGAIKANVMLDDTMKGSLVSCLT